MRSGSNVGVPLAGLRRLATSLDLQAAGGLLNSGGGLFRKAPEPPRGLYLWGGVGRGKSMLMDLFVESLDGIPARRVHFHAFMIETHARIAEARKTGTGDPIPQVAGDIANETRLLCFDELHVTDIADAMILGRLFKVLFARDVVVVATSNAAPENLYRNGLNRQLFLPFIDLIDDHMDVLELISAKDFRLERLTGKPVYFSPLGEAADRGMDDLWQSLTSASSGEETTLWVQGRKVVVPRNAMGIARFSFEDLCEQPLGAADYLAIAQAFHTVMIDHVPALTPERRNAARRFITLIDALYDNRIALAMSAAAEPNAIYESGDGADLFQRTASRLNEMRSADYLEARGAARSI